MRNNVSMSISWSKINVKQVWVKFHQNPLQMSIYKWTELDQFNHTLKESGLRKNMGLEKKCDYVADKIEK